MLTTGTDNVTGTSGNDTIIGDNSGTATFNVSDVINGGGGTDVLKVYSPGALESFAAPNVTDVENLYVYGATLTNAATYDMSGAGFTSLEVDTSTAAGGTFTIKTSATQDVALKAVNADATSGATTLNIDGAKS